MAIAKKCDVCGKLYELYNLEHDEDKPNGITFLNIDYIQEHYYHDDLDCCPQCMNSIKDHLLMLSQV